MDQSDIVPNVDGEAGSSSSRSVNNESMEQQNSSQYALRQPSQQRQQHLQLVKYMK